MNKGTVRFEQAGAAPVIHFVGEISGTVESSLRDLYQTHVRAPGGRLVFHFGEMDYINSAGIAVLISYVTGSGAPKHDYVFAGLSPHFRKIMDVVGLTEFVAIHDTLAEALS